MDNQAMEHIKEVLRQGRYAEASKEINEILYSSGDPRLYQLWAFIRAVEFNESVETVKINLRLGTLIFAPSFVLNYMESLDDLLFMIIHERSHLVLGLEYPGRVPQLLRGRHLNLGTNAIFKFIEDVWCNSMAYRMFPSHISSRYYADKDVSFRLLCPEKLDEEVFGSRLQDEHNIVYRKPRNPGYLFSLVWEWIMEQRRKKPVKTVDRMSSGEEDSHRDKAAGKTNPELEDKDTDITGQSSKSKQDSFFGLESGKNSDSSGDETKGPADRAQDYESMRKTGAEQDKDKEETPQADPDALNDYEGIVISETLSTSDFVTTNPEKFYDNPAPETRKGVTFLVEKAPLNRWNDWDFQILRATKLLAEIEEASRLTREEKQSYRTNTNIKIMTADISRLMIQQNTENTITGFTHDMPHHLARSDAFSLAMGYTPLMWRTLYNAGKNRPDFHIYFDVSGSMAQHYVLLPRLLSQLRPYVSRMFQFSDSVTEIRERDFKKIYTTKGTNFLSAVEAFHTYKSKYIIMLSDGHSKLDVEKPDFIKQFIYLATYRPYRETSDAWRKWATYVIQLQ